MPERHVLGETKQQNQIGSEISITEREVSGFSNSTKNSAKSNTVSDANIRKSGNKGQRGPTHFRGGCLGVRVTMVKWHMQVHALLVRGIREGRDCPIAHDPHVCCFVYLPSAPGGASSPVSFPRNKLCFLRKDKRKLVL